VFCFFARELCLVNIWLSSLSVSLALILRPVCLWLVIMVLLPLSSVSWNGLIMVIKPLYFLCLDSRTFTPINALHLSSVADPGRPFRKFGIRIQS
jgi:hypothetical protein